MRNKRKGILMASAILGSAAIVSTGFAAWIITTPAEETAQGTIAVDTVSDNRVKLSVDWTTGDGNVKFGTDGGTYTWTDTSVTPNKVQNAWLQTSGTTVQENLTHKLTVTASYINGEAHKVDGVVQKPTGTVTASFKVYKAGEEYTLSSQEQTLVVIPTIQSSYTLVNGTFEIDCSFAWGTAFDGKNPNEFYNTQKYTDDLGTQAYNNLLATYALNELTYQLVLTYSN